MGFSRKETMSTRDYEEKIREELMPFTDVPIFCICFNKTTIIESIEATVKCLKADNNVSLLQNSTNT
jgi:GTP-binding protein